jgi:hypothetical protein
LPVKTWIPLRKTTDSDYRWDTASENNPARPEDLDRPAAGETYFRLTPGGSFLFPLLAANVAS